MIDIIKAYLSKRGLRIVICFSIGYAILGILMLAPAIENISNLFNLSLEGLSRFGSFLAGVFSPLAFIWLLIGYKMQDKGIKDSLKNTQDAQELNRNQFEFQKAIIIKEQKERHNRAQPELYINNITATEKVISLKIKNSGEPIFNIKFFKEDSELFCLSQKTSIKKDEEVAFGILTTMKAPSLNQNEYSVFLLALSMEFIDSTFEMQKTKISISATDMFDKITYYGTIESTLILNS